MIVVGRVTRPHGVRGELRVVPYEFTISDLADVEQVTLRSEAGAERRWGLRSLRDGPRGAWLVTLEGLTDRDDAQALAGHEVLAEKALLPELVDGEYYRDQLIGLAVEDTKGKALGEVVEIFNSGSADVVTVRRGEHEWMFPATEEILLEIDVEEGRMVLDPLPGLLEGGK